MKREQNKRGGRQRREDAPFNNKEKKSFGNKRAEERESDFPNRKTVKKTEKSKDIADSSGKIRLNKYVANAGVCSRREADKLIEKGEVSVNGKVVTQLGTSVELTDNVSFNGKRLNPETKVYVLLNKPKGYVTTVEDKHAKQTVMDLVQDACDERIYPVGRLDKQTTGLLLLTNDGDLTKQLTHPKYNAKKIYHVFTDKPVFANHVDQLASGITLEDGPIHADAVSYVEKDDKTQVGIEIHSGRNRIVRRMFEHFGYKVMKLDRVFFAGLTKRNVPRGKWRYLSDKEVTRLKAGMLK
ncbi:pseudouridine synthase [Carboxylicivirga sp. M1479]|uniref:pseudouridine synthase n=1 Tax=Carboxylicivirga sp. M1479 TaxID=2594476 RepID=UPI0011780E87|nr:pseudouridine synthase [Carboxylicivirga sp. M1479]TRX71907.1 rRNA pseudouridine synthase [Carboxylicivirga sp. M1479]